MDISKLKLDKFTNIRLENFPDDIDLGITSSDADTEVVIYYIDHIEDVSKFVDLCHSLGLPSENRTIMVYKKGRKDRVNRDSIFMPFKEGTYPDFKLKAPMLCSISSELSACVMAQGQ